jgi:type I restriction enzyme S subunit
MRSNLSSVCNQSSPLGLVPEGWSIARLQDITTKIGSGATPRGGSKVYFSTRENYALVRSQHVFDRYFDRQGLVFISDEHAAELSKVALQPRDVLLNITGDGITFGRSCIVPDDVLPACVNQHVSIIRVNPEVCLPEYLLCYLTHPSIKGYIESFNAGGSRRAITKGHIESFEVPLPPLDEQKAIAQILSSLDDKIELNQQMNRTLEAIARALFKSWFIDFDPVRAKLDGRQPAGMDAETAALFPAEFEDGGAIGKIPKGWQVGRLDDLIVLQRGFDLPKTARTPGKYPVLAASGPSGTHSEYKVKGPGVTTGRSGVLGKVFFVHEDFWPLNTSLWVKEFRYSRPIHAYHLLRDLNFEVFNAGSAVPTLNRNHVHGLPVVDAPLSVVEKFEEIVTPLFKQCRANEEQSTSIASFRDTLLPKLLSGELKSKDAETVLEEVE